MYNLIPHFALIVGLAGVLVIVSRKLPALSVLEAEEKPLIPLKVKIWCRNILCRLKERLNADKIQMFLLARLEKFLRRFRIVTLKVDNGTFSWLKKIREKSVMASPAAYWSVLGAKEATSADDGETAVREAEDL
jgi:hypothetical protein